MTPKKHKEKFVKRTLLHEVEGETPDENRGSHQKEEVEPMREQEQGGRSRGTEKERETEKSD